jgi:hypothetical protein
MGSDTDSADGPKRVFARHGSAQTLWSTAIRCSRIQRSASTLRANDWGRSRPSGARNRARQGDFRLGRFWIATGNSIMAHAAQTPITARPSKTVRAERPSTAPAFLGHRIGGEEHASPW